MSLPDAMNGAMTWAEMVAIARLLVRDPSSQVGAAVGGLLHPWSYEAFIAADHIDAFYAANAPRNAKVKPYPRPTDTEPVRMGDATQLSQDEIRAWLKRVGPQRREPKRDERGRFTTE